MDDIYTQLRIRRSTNQKLKLIGALTGEKLIDLIERWCNQELARYEINEKDTQVQAVQQQKE